MHSLENPSWNGNRWRRGVARVTVTRRGVSVGVRGGKRALAGVLSRDFTAEVVTSARGRAPRTAETARCRRRAARPPQHLAKRSSFGGRQVHATLGIPRSRRGSSGAVPAGAGGGTRGSSPSGSVHHALASLGRVGAGTRLARTRPSWEGVFQVSRSVFGSAPATCCRR